MSNERLKVPIGALLDDRLPESRARHLWKRIEAARAARVVPRSRTWALAAFAAGAAAAIVFWLDHGLKPGALHLLGGGAVPVAIGGGTNVRVALDDGSELDVARDSRVEVLESTGEAFTVALRRGTTEFEVHPGGPRVWHVECAGVVIEVVGTHFTVARTRESLRVAVQRGVVLVRGEAVPDRVVLLNAGESIVVPLTNPETATSTKAQQPPAEAPAVAPVAPHVERAVEKPSMVEPAAAPALPNRASFATNDAGAPSPDATDAALTHADSLRRAGRFGDAARVLETLLAEHGSDPRASLAEFSLGRLYLESLGDANGAATHFSRALVRRLPAALAEDARARLVEAYARAGNRPAAQSAAATYRSLYPNGRRLNDVAEWAR